MREVMIGVIAIIYIFIGAGFSVEITENNLIEECISKNKRRILFLLCLIFLPLLLFSKFLTCSMNYIEELLKYLRK